MRYCSQASLMLLGLRVCWVWREALRQHNPGHTMLRHDDETTWRRDDTQQQYNASKRRRLPIFGSPGHILVTRVDMSLDTVYIFHTHIPFATLYIPLGPGIHECLHRGPLHPAPLSSLFQLIMPVLLYTGAPRPPHIPQLAPSCSPRVFVRDVVDDASSCSKVHSGRRRVWEELFDSCVNLLQERLDLERLR
jgi:hypothetical protein